MNESKKELKALEQRYKIVQQQQFTFIAALEHVRENAHEKNKGVNSIAQVRHYLDNYCNRNTDQRILSMFLDLCSDLADYCVKLDGLQNETRSADGLLETCMNLLTPTNDLSKLRAKFPHDVVNHLSCDEAKNYYGGVVSVLPLAMDCIQEAVYKMEKPKPHMRLMGSGQPRGAKSDDASVGVQTLIFSHQRKPKDQENKMLEPERPPWKVTGKVHNP
ncbi:sperm acrosome-associated protein 9 isoform 1-T1 [Discoglossus pictus]